MEIIENICYNISENEVKRILTDYGYKNEIIIEKYTAYMASDKMLGFLCDYWRLNVSIVDNNNSKKSLSFFIKAISKSNAAKANMVKEFKLFEKELTFYSVIKNNLDVPGITPWSAKLITALDDAMVFQDLNQLQYRSQNKFDRFDVSHTLQALQTLARFHATSIIFEEKMSKKLQRSYNINEEYEECLNKAGYQELDPWFIQCRDGALEAIKTFSKYNKCNQLMNSIQNLWVDVWTTALSLSDCSSEHRNVICHRDLWNNNIMFHYKTGADGCVLPDDCLLVDFQAARYHPPAGDVMLLLCCNLDPKFREANLEKFLNHYYQELKIILGKHGISLEAIIPRVKFLRSAKEQRQWGLIVCACLMPQFWIEDEAMKAFFYDSSNFDEILCKNKISFIKKMMRENEDYRCKVLQIFEEIVERYCIDQNEL